MRFLILLTILALPLTAADPLAQYRALLLTLQQQEELPAPSYTNLEAILIPWLEAQLAVGSSVEQIEQQLKAAKLLNPNGSVGTVVGLSSEPVPGSDFAALSISLQYSKFSQDMPGPMAGCGAIMPVLIYQANPYRRVIFIRPKPTSERMPLAPSAFLVTPPDATGQRFLASSWTISRCTSTFTEATFRLHRLGSDGPPLWQRSAFIKQREQGDLVPHYQSSTVYFPFYRPLNDEHAVEGPDLFAVHHTDEGIEDISPPAGSIAALLQRWLDVRRPRTPIEWKSYGRCGSPAEVELGITLDDQLTYIRISARSADSLRIISSSNTRSCPTINLGPNLPPVFDLLPPYQNLLKRQF